MKCPQILREKTSSQKSKEISLRIGGYLPADSDGKYLQKMNYECPHILIQVPSKSECKMPSDF